MCGSAAVSSVVPVCYRFALKKEMSMPRLVNAVPRYRKHRRSGQAIVECGGRIHYLGPHGTPESREKYDRIIAAWIAAGRPKTVFSPSLSESQPPPSTEPQQSVPLPLPSPPEPRPVLPPLPRSKDGDVTIVELISRFWEYAEKRYIKYGEPTGTHLNYRTAIRLLRADFGKCKVKDFGPRALKSLRAKMIDEGTYCRRYINDNIERIRSVFNWGVSEELVPVELALALERVEGIPKGSANVFDYAEIEPVPKEIMEKTLLHLPPVVADMARLECLTGCRPGEICIMRPMDLDVSDETWVYRPHRHKTEHHGKRRHIILGPKAIEILKPYLNRATDAFCFSPLEVQAIKNRERRKNRQTPLTPSHLNRRPKPDGKRRPGNRYTSASYRRAIARACEQAFPPPPGLNAKEIEAWREKHHWFPNQLRHTAATNICNNSKESLLGAKEALGHSSIRTTEGYVQSSLELAKNVMRKLG
jgi:integrase